MKPFKQILYMCLIPLMLVTKVIEYPFTFNFSPADFLMLIVGPLLLIDFLKDAQWRKEIVKNNIVRVFFLLVLVRALSSFASLFLDIERLTLIGMLVANIKFIMSFAYFLAGIKAKEILGNKRLLIVAYTSTYFFLMVGLLSAIIFKFEWTGLDRMVSLANDPNVAGMVCLFGVLLGVNLIATQKNVYYKTILFFSLIPFGFGIILTGSRTALGAATLLGLGLLYMYRRTPKKLVIIVTSILIILNLTLVIETQIMNSENIDYLISRVYFDTDSAYDYRNSLSRMATEMGNDYWLTGIGTGHFLINSEHYFLQYNEDSGNENLVTHNTFLSFYAENGVIGFLGYAILLGLFFKTSRNHYARIYMVLLIFYSLFFNIENIRFVWFLYGVWLYSTVEERVQDLVISWKYIGTTSVLGILLALVMMPKIFVPFNLDNQSFEIAVENELELFIDFRNIDKRPILVGISGEINENHIIKNDLGFYYERFTLKQGKYQITFEGEGGDVFVNRMVVIGKDSYDAKRKTPWSEEIKLQKTNKLAQLSSIPLGFRKYSVDILSQDDDIVYENSIEGANYSNEIQLVASHLDRLSGSGYVYTLEFEKIGEINHEYMYMFRGYPTSLENYGEVNELVLNYDFEQALITLPIGEHFSATWKFDTAGEPFMIYSGFYYIDTYTNKLIQPKPNFIYHGFVQ